MTAFDGFFVGMAVVDLCAVGALAYVGLQMKNRMMGTVQSAQPAIADVKLLVDRGKTMATTAKEQGTVVIDRVKAVLGKVKDRVETTRRIAGELKPARETATLARETGADVLEKTRATAGRVNDFAQRLRRVKSAAEAAARAARRG